MTDDAVLRKFISDDLYNELRYLLVAATHWAAYDELVDKKPRKLDFPRHFKVLALDSSLLHARSLYEFFTAEDKRHSFLWTWKTFGLPKKVGPSRYGDDEKFRIALNKRLMHLEPGRSEAVPIKDEVVTIAKEVLSLWDTFTGTAEVAIYTRELAEAREKAILDSRKTAQCYSDWHFLPIFS